MESSLVTFLPIGLAGFEDADDSVVESEIGNQGGLRANGGKAFARPLFPCYEELKTFQFNRS